MMTACEGRTLESMNRNRILSDVRAVFDPGSGLGQSPALRFAVVASRSSSVSRMAGRPKNLEVVSGCCNQKSLLQENLAKGGSSSM